MNRRLGSVVLIATLPLSTFAAIPGSAFAAAQRDEPPSTSAMAQAADQMLTWGDVPPSLKVDPGWEFTTKADPLLALELCTKQSKTITTPPAPVMYQVELGETTAITDPLSIQQNIWQYPSEAQARRAWETTQRRAKRCTGRSVERGSQGSSNIQYLTNGATEVRVNGEPGIWIQSRFSRQLANDATSEGGYYVVFLNGSVLQSMEYDYADTIELTQGKRLAVQKLSQRLAERWTVASSAQPAIS
jgi:hypothetical protein